MAHYRLAPEAEVEVEVEVEVDLYRIWLYGARQWGIAAADDYHRSSADPTRQSRLDYH